MIPYKELVQINKKLSVLIWINILSISLLVIISVIMIVYQWYWLILLILLVAITHLSVTYWLHVKMKKHTKPGPM